MSIYLDRFAAERDPDVHAVIVLDRAGWHGPNAIDVPHNIALVPSPPYSPELTPVERLRRYPRERFLSLRVLDDDDAIVDACCRAWNALAADPATIRSLCQYPSIAKFSSSTRRYYSDGL